MVLNVIAVIPREATLTEAVTEGILDAPVPGITGIVRAIRRVNGMEVIGCRYPWSASLVVMVKDTGHPALD
jgi:hypothetical protein